ncbi:hypothetical protein F5Y16DRAFT_21448 [Xylariaceae sp. FL0255]|nr:hypothetical protein F5Y16DRAFT_21448 [Xylariaceae sp. FL0255]
MCHLSGRRWKPTIAAMAALTHPLMPSNNSDSNRVAAWWKKLTGRNNAQPSPPSPVSEPPLSRASSPGSSLIRRVSRRVVPGLPRAKTFKRQLSEDRDKLAVNPPTASERRAHSVDNRQMQSELDSSLSSQAPPQPALPSFLSGAENHLGPSNVLAHSVSAPQSPIDEKQFLSFGDLGALPNSNSFEDDSDDERAPTQPEEPSTADAQSTTTSRYDAIIHEELENKWILNLSMHFRDRSRREKFFVTYREDPYSWRRVTISLDYRDAPFESLEHELLNTKFQRDKSAKIYEAIRESLQDIQFYETVTNLKLQTSDGRLHVHVVEDVNEIIHFPSVRMVQHMKSCPRIRESELEFDSHMSGFVYKVRVDGKTLIKKEIPGPDTIDEFLYEVNALHSLRYSKGIIEFYGVVVDDDDQNVKGLLISYAEKGALIDVIYDSQERGEQDLPWQVREKWARQIVQGLSDIHETGFVQGDFTLSNIVIDDLENAKIIDINRRGCPVGWEPPEATPLIDSNQRITMYIGVKSDLYQLGMVLWALATLEDEPEAHPRPLRLRAELGVPDWYRKIVETCLHEKPQARLQATTLLRMFPVIPLDERSEEDPSIISVQAGGSYASYAVNENEGPPQVRVVEPRSSWPYSSASNASRSFSDGRYPSRGRSPPSPSPYNCDQYRLPISRDAMGIKVLDTTVMDDDLAIDEERVDTPTDLEAATALIPEEMGDEIDRIEADVHAEAGLKDEQPQLPDGDSQADDASVHSIDLGPIPEHIIQDEELVTHNDWLKVTAPRETTSINNIENAAVLAVDGSDSGLSEPGENVGSPTTVVPGIEDEDPTAPDEHDTDVKEETDDSVMNEPNTTEPNEAELDATTHDRTDAGTEDMLTQPTEAPTMTETDSTSQKDLSLADSLEPTVVGAVDIATEEVAQDTEAAA